MSRTHTSRRLSLLASASAALAGLTGAAVLGLSLIPTAALADEECGDPDTNLGAADSFLCPVDSYPAGITYESNGDLDLTVQSGSTLGPGVLVTAGDADDNLAVHTTGGHIFGIHHDALVIIDVESESGNAEVTVEEGNLVGDDPVTTHGIRAASRDGGNVDVAVATLVSVTGSAGIAAVDARSLGGDGDVTISGSYSGRLFGVVAQASGTGDIAFSGSAVASNPGGGTGIQAQLATGTFNFEGGATGGAGPAIDVDTAGDVNIDVTGPVRAGTGNLDGTPTNPWVIDIASASGRTVTINNTGSIKPGDSSISVDDFGMDDRSIRVSGASNVVIDNDALIVGRVNFLGMPASGGVTFTNGGSGISSERGWRVGGESAFSLGGDLLVNEADGVIATSSGGVLGGGISSSPTPVNVTTVIDFREGHDAFENQGLLVVGAGRTCNLTCYATDSLTTLVRLEEFNNSGLILMGAFATPGDEYLTTDADSEGQVLGIGNDDTLTMRGATFTGSGDSRVVFDVALSDGGQTVCGQRVADCIDVRGGATGGSTLVTINDVFLGDRGDNADVLLVDVNGGTGAQGHFTLDPNSDLYDPMFGGVIHKGLFVYPLLYDEANGRHVLAAVASPDALQFAPVVHSVQEIWRTSTGSWFQQQAEGRDNMGGPRIGGGTWARATFASSERDVSQATGALGYSFDVEETVSQEGYGATAGLDLLAVTDEGRGAVLGFMLGYVHSQVDFDASPNAVRFDGFSTGLYGGLLAGGFFLDAAVNATGLTMDYEIPSLNLYPADSLVTSNITSLGAQVETGYRLRFGRTGFVEPLATLSLVRADFDDVFARSADVSRPGNTLSYNDATSIRGGAGARVGMSSDLGAVRVSYSLSGRFAEEFAGDAEVALQSQGPDAFVTNAFTGGFSEVGGAVSAFSETGALSGFVEARAQFGDDYRGFTGSAGVRLRW